MHSSRPLLYIISLNLSVLLPKEIPSHIFTIENQEQKIKKVILPNESAKTKTVVSETSQTIFDEKALPSIASRF